MVHQRIVAGLAVASGVAATVLIANHFVKKAEGEEPLPPIEQNTPGVLAGVQGSVVIAIEDAQQFAPDFFIFDTRFSNLAEVAQTFEAIMQIKDPNNTIQTIKTTKITVEARSSRKVRFATGNLFNFAVIRGVWIADFFAWKSFELPIPLSDTITQEFIVDVL